MIILSHIVAAAKNDVIGVNNALPWHIPEDLKFFRAKTKGRSIIMGRKTFESVGHPLPHRLNVVVTRQKDYQAKDAVVCSDLFEAIEHCKTRVAEFGEEIFIIGGGEIFNESLSLVQRVYLTRIHQDYPGEITYPQLNMSEFVEVERVDREDPQPFSFLTYERKK